jgi:hypothetical protein
MRKSVSIAAFMMLASLATVAQAQDTVHLLLNNAPATPGDYKCDAIHYNFYPFQFPAALLKKATTGSVWI